MNKEWEKSVAARIQSIAQGLVVCIAVFTGQSVSAAVPKAVATQNSACAWSIVERKRVLNCGGHIANYSYNVADERLVSRPYQSDVDVAEQEVTIPQASRYAIDEMAEPVEAEFYEDLNEALVEEGRPSPPSIPVINVADHKPQVARQYMVVTIASELEIMARLKDFADTDYLILHRSPLENRVSLGVFSTIENARTRSGQAAEFQIETEVIDRASSKPIARLEPRNLLNKREADTSLLSSTSD